MLVICKKTFPKNAIHIRDKVTRANNVHKALQQEILNLCELLIYQNHILNGKINKEKLTIAAATSSIFYEEFQ